MFRWATEQCGCWILDLWRHLPQSILCGIRLGQHAAWRCAEELGELGGVGGTMDTGINKTAGRKQALLSL